MILMIDNYDSFTYNVYQYIGSLYPQIQVVRNDEITIDEIRNLQNLEALVISPGPGYPDSAGISKEAIKTFEKKFQSWESVWDIRQSEKYMAEKSFQQKN
jgi:trpG_papA: glutamine amidotransferase of anthranilate synthase or aminodeoxychorismate synthase